MNPKSMWMSLIGAAIAVIAATPAAVACEWNSALRILTCEDAPQVPSLKPEVAIGMTTDQLATPSPEVEAHIRTFRTELTALGTGGLDTAKDLQALVEQLTKTGTPSAQAYQAVQTIAGNPEIKQILAPQIAYAARDVAATLPSVGGFISAENQLITALTGGNDAIIQLGIKWNSLSIDQIRQIRQHAVDYGEAQQMLVRGIDQRMGGGFNNSRTGAARAARDQ
jgi:hypothetical protein